ncbi:MAG: hypothetical protein Q8K96_13760 [Rubrivivax sp.]|nr:hypothetical protein [Rubrivivax sp.]
MEAPDRLSELRAELAARLAQALADPAAPLAGLRELQERLKLLDTALADRAARGKRRLGVMLWPVGLVGLMLLLAATVPVPSVPLSLSLKASAIQLDLADAAVLGPLTVDAAMRIEGFSALESADAPLVQAAAREQADRITVRAGESRLRALRLPAGARLGVEARRDATALGVESSRSPIVVELEVRGATSLLLADATSGMARDYAQGEWLRLVAGDPAHIERAPPPMLLTLSRGGETPLRLQGLRPTALRFIERRDGGVAESTLGSSIQAATLTLPATGQALALAAGDWLEIDDLVVERLEIVSGATLTLELNGSARVLRQRSGEFERSLKPSWLEYISRHHLTKLLWGSAAVLWGALAWARRQFAAGPP